MAFLECEVSETSELAQQIEEWSFKVVVGFPVVFKRIVLLAITADKLFDPFGFDFRVRAEGVDAAEYFWKFRLFLWRSIVPAATESPHHFLKAGPLLGVAHENDPVGKTGAQEVTTGPR